MSEEGLLEKKDRLELLGAKKYVENEPKEEQIKATTIKTRPLKTTAMIGSSLCPHWEQLNCPWGDSCHYIHSPLVLAKRSAKHRPVGQQENRLDRGVELLFSMPKEEQERILQLKSQHKRPAGGVKIGNELGEPGRVSVWAYGWSKMLV